MKQYIDMHSHIAWDIDDGFPNIEDSKKALEEASKNGIIAICSTPHFIYSQLSNERLKLIKNRQRELFDCAKKFDIQIFPGAEMFMDENFIYSLDEGLYQTMNNSKYLLAEFDVRKDIHDVDNFDDRLYEIEIRKLVPIIAHAERYFRKGIDWDIIDDWFDRGFIIQVNRTSLQGLHGKIIKNNAWSIIKEGKAHLVSSDAHRAEGHRVERLDDIEEELINVIGEDNTNLLLYKNPIHILRDEEVENLKPMKKKKSIFFWKNK